MNSASVYSKCCCTLKLQCEDWHLCSVIHTQSKYSKLSRIDFSDTQQVQFINEKYRITRFSKTLLTPPPPRNLSQITHPSEVLKVRIPSFTTIALLFVPDLGLDMGVS